VVNLIEPLDGEVLARIRTGGLRLPLSAPGVTWQPRTATETHLLREGQRLDRVRQLLLGEVGWLRARLGVAAGRRGRAAAAARAAERLVACPLSTGQLAIVAAAAAGESVEETARRLSVTGEAVKSQRQRAVHAMSARNMTHAVAVSVAAGWLDREQILTGAAS
jgi:DNA-binding CsgD family transcriptional regulator